MNITIEKKDGFLAQCIAFSSLFLELHRHNFLESEFFANMDFLRPGVKEIIKDSNIGNPVMMQMMLYALIVVPKEMKLDESNPKLECSFKKTLNKLIGKLVDKQGTMSTYKYDHGGNIKYFLHLRNAISHCSYEFITENNVNFVVFKDRDKNSDQSVGKDKSCSKLRSQRKRGMISKGNDSGVTQIQECTIKMRCDDVEKVMLASQDIILNYLKSKYWKNKTN